MRKYTSILTNNECSGKNDFNQLMLNLLMNAFTNLSIILTDSRKRIKSFILRHKFIPNKKGFNGIIVMNAPNIMGMGEGIGMTILWGNIIITLVAGLLGIAVVVLGIIGLISFARKNK